MQLRALPLVLALALVPSLTGCEIGEIGIAGFRFTTPGTAGALVADPNPEFVLRVPKTRTGVQVWVDDVPLDAQSFTSSATEVRGPLDDVAPGIHELRAQVTLSLFFRSLAVQVTTTTAFERTAAPGFTVRESIEQLHVTHAAPGTTLGVIDAGGSVVDNGVVDYQGSLIFREVEPGDGYRVVTTGFPREASRALRVEAVETSTPEQSFYDDQVLAEGYGYLTTRDGTQLSVFVSLPGPPEDGPYPVVVNYSGYDPSQPVGEIVFGGLNFCTLMGNQFPVFCDAPNAPETLVAGLLGFASVGVNMRGTGCSGGAYDFFEPLQLTDGYDIIETVAAQPWAYKVGMVGISFPGISQLFVASMHPPSLAAITPLAVISGVDTTMNPGGIINDGFAVEWGTQVLNRADPYGHGWEQGQVDAGDVVCEENQLLHSQKVDIIQKAYDHPYYEAEIYDPLNPRTFVGGIDVPVFTSGAWQDEQTGGHFPDLWNRFTGSPLVRYTGYNGAHADGFTPQVLAEWKNFLDFYVSDEIRPIPQLVRQMAPLLFESTFGARVALPDERFADYETFEAALADYEAEPPIRILMENGSGDNGVLGAPEAGFELFFDSWPPPNTEPKRLYLHADGSLQDDAPLEAASASSFQHDDAKGQETYLVNDSFEQALPDIAWLPETPGRQVVFLSEAMTEDVVLIGHASADLWIQSSATDADLEVTLSEVRPDGQERYIASGWLRASRRALSPESTELKPVQTHLEADVAPLPAGAWTPVRVEIYPFAHALRAGTQLRMSVATPGGNKGRWKFDVLQLGAGVTHAVAHDADHPSSLVLPVIPGVVVPTPLPACPSLRSQPCRTHQPQLNAIFE
jgi:predicted acyl esterase